MGGVNKFFTFQLHLSQPAPWTTRKLFCLLVTWWGTFYFIWDGRNLRNVGRILTFSRAKLLTIEFLIEILTIWPRDNENWRVQELYVVRPSQNVNILPFFINVELLNVPTNLRDYVHGEWAVSLLNSPWARTAFQSTVMSSPTSLFRPTIMIPSALQGWVFLLGAYQANLAMHAGVMERRFIALLIQPARISTTPFLTRLPQQNWNIKRKHNCFIQTMYMINSAGTAHVVQKGVSNSVENTFFTKTNKG